MLHGALFLLYACSRFNSKQPTNKSVAGKNVRVSSSRSADNSKHWSHLAHNRVPLSVRNATIDDDGNLVPAAKKSRPGKRTIGEFLRSLPSPLWRWLIGGQFSRSRFRGCRFTSLFFLNLKLSSAPPAEPLQCPKCFKAYTRYYLKRHVCKASIVSGDNTGAFEGKCTR